MADVKKYELIDASRPTAPIYLQVSPDEAVHQNVLPLWSPYLKIEVVQGGVMRIARLKLAAKSIWLDEQIAAGIPANVDFTQQERDAVKFLNGVCYAKLQIVKDFLDATPQNIDFEGDRGEYVGYFKSVDENAKKKALNQSWKQKQKAAAKIADMDLETAQEWLMRINGTFFAPPADLDECQNMLIEYVDEVEDGAENLLDESFTAEQNMNLTVNKAVFKNILSFNQTPNEVSYKAKGQWKKVRTSDSTLDAEERQRQFVEYLLSDAGTTLADELKKATAKVKLPEQNAGGETEDQKAARLKAEADAKGKE